ncbi:PepSY domain-containing protein [Siphonobacter sp. BAB-5405]|uniref:PepSY domain-containing protein n=1 Tax=Siphonobacter sp. BAB-5405 TaxID=1864825 RepID=UPI001E3BFF59|nr:PepSY-associated TM helix domain-containing protein [Siphonobacter sp. BAB-5405]
MNYDIHVGSVLGFPGKVLAFLASLIGASLPVTGFLVWWNRKGFGKGKGKKKASGDRTLRPANATPAAGRRLNPS